MWRLVVVLCVLHASDVFAGERRSVLQVGIIITGNANSSTLNPKPAAGRLAGPQMAVPLPPERPVAVGARDSVSSSR